MRSKIERVKTVKTDETHKKDTACGLYKEGHKIAARFHHVLIAARDTLNAEVQLTAGGCSGCVTCDIETSPYICYVAQTHSVDRIAIRYGAADSDTNVTSEDIARALVAAAERLGVEVSWDGDTDKRVYLGDGTVYDD